MNNESSSWWRTIIGISTEARFSPNELMEGVLKEADSKADARIVHAGDATLDIELSLGRLGSPILRQASKRVEANES